jgi:hypothetical protein
MKINFQKAIGYANIGLGVLCILSWLFNTLGWIKFGDPVAQLIMVPVCFVLGTALLNSTSQTK